MKSLFVCAEMWPVRCLNQRCEEQLRPGEELIATTAARLSFNLASSRQKLRVADG